MLTRADWRTSTAIHNNNQKMIQAIEGLLWNLCDELEVAFPVKNGLVWYCCDVAVQTIS